MATSTLGTNATTSLTSLVYQRGLIPADAGSINAMIKYDGGDTGKNPVNQSFDYGNGLLMIPRRGWLKLLPGDYVAVDPATGWPILISSNALATGGTVFTHT